jgi:ATP-dependent Lon protease
VLDPEQNSTFTDHYLEVPFDLSEVFFICTGNVKYQIPRPLADRLDIIDLPGYILEEKINIGQQHLLPKVMTEHGIAPEQLKIPQSVMQQIVTGYTREAGVRNLERQLATICRKAARRILEKPDSHIRLTSHNLEHYLGPPHYTDSPVNLKMQIGTAMGLAVTEMGGILLPVEVATMVGRGELIVTGNIQDVMRESAIAALSYIRTRAEELQIDPNFQDGTDLHIHLPENALPKDGPSAGITIAVALISALTGRPVRPGIALTGEITLRGRVLAIGGLKEKALAAYHANIFHLVIPGENRKDLAEIPTKIRQRMRFTIVDTMDQVIDEALLAASLDENAAEEPFRELPPLQVDERSSTKRKNQRQRADTPANEKPGENGNEQSPFILPPGEHMSGDSYPHLQAKDSEEPEI